MNHPWKEIKLSDYENHMSMDSVYQLQMMNEIMKEQLSCYEISTAIILGVAGGNGLSHIKVNKLKKIYGVDINREYLKVCEERYKELAGILCMIEQDLTNEKEKLPKAELLIANLLIEYIGYEHFQRNIKNAEPRYVSCIIQVNADEMFVSDSPFLHVFDKVEEVHHKIEEKQLNQKMYDIGYVPIVRDERRLPNDKYLVRLDYERRMPEKGCIHIYEGDGKGKTTAAVGLGIRYAGTGGRVLFTQFLKRNDSGELNILEQIENIYLLRCEKNFGFTFRMTPEEKEIAAIYYNAHLKKVLTEAVENEIGLLVLDEVIDACNHNLIEQKELQYFLKEKPQKMEVVLTGRKPAEELLELADYVTYMEKRKHPYDKGMGARKGIEL